MSACTAVVDLRCCSFGAALAVDGTLSLLDATEPFSSGGLVSVYQTSGATADKTSGLADYRCVTVAATGRVAFVGTGQGHLVALQPTKGSTEQTTELWRCTGRTVASSVRTVYAFGGRVYVGWSDGLLRSVDMETGEICDDWLPPLPVHGAPPD